jgi:hypothetical protein
MLALLRRHDTHRHHHLAMTANHHHQMTDRQLKRGHWSQCKRQHLSTLHFPWYVASRMMMKMAVVEVTNFQAEAMPTSRRDWRFLRIQDCC